MGFKSSEEVRVAIEAKRWKTGFSAVTVQIEC